jgi:amino acid transporter
MLFALSFAEVSSRFDATGGSYLFTRAAFGRFAAFEVGWLMWFTRAASWAAVMNVLAASIGFYWPSVTAGWPRAVLITAIVGAIAWINIRGIRQSSLVVNVLTVGKLLPLIVFIIAGILAMDPGRLAPQGDLTVESVSSGVLLLIFAFGGYEIVPVTAGETREPRHVVPFALIMTIAIVTIVMTLVQVVALGTLPDLTQSRTPLADAATIFLGAAGGVLITMGAVVSTSGNNMGSALSGSRNLFALAEQGDLPAFFGKVHPRYRTPVTAIAVTAGVTLILALSGTFSRLALVSAVSRLVVYAFTCAATLRLRNPRFAGIVKPAMFVVPFGPVIPASATLIAIATLAGARREQLVAGLMALAVGSILFVIASRPAHSKALKTI